MKQILGMVVVLAAVLTVSACTASTPSPASVGATPPGAASPLASANADPTMDAAVPQAPPTPNATAAVFAPVDSGPQPAASGTVTVDADGNPATYTVADGDAVSAIADRFGIYVYGLTKPDGSRQSSWHSEIVTGEVLGFRTYDPSCRSKPDPNACN